MKTIVVLYLFLAAGIRCSGQEQNDSLKISFLFSQQPVRVAADPVLRIVYRNLTNRYIDVYRSLHEADADDRFGNLYVLVEKRQDGKFAEYVTGSHDIDPLVYYDMRNDSLRHFDLPMKKLAPFSSDTLTINLLNYHSLLDTGEYRFNAQLRIRTIRDTTPFNDPNGEKAPPLDKLIYRPSGWIYFSAEKIVSRPMPGNQAGN